MNKIQPFRDFLNREKEDDSDDSDDLEIDYQNKNFGKYEKFKQKNKRDSNTENKLKKAENQVKNLLSFFISNIEKENKDTEIKNEDETNQNFRNIMTPKYKSKYKQNYTTRVNNYDKNSFKSLSLNNFNNIKDETNKKPFKEEKKVFGRRKSTKKNINENYNSPTQKISKFKEKMNIIFQRTKSIGSHILKHNTNLKKENNKNINLDKSIDLNSNNKKSLIKKYNSNNQNNSYLNFKKDFNLKNSSDKNKLDILKIIKNDKKDIFNESNNNSLLSDFSDYNLNKKSSIFKNSKKNNDSSLLEIKNISSISKSNIKKSSIMNKTKLSEIKIKGTKSPIDKNKVSLKNSNEINRTENSNRIDKNHKFPDISRFLSLDNNFRSLKVQLKNSITLCPENLELSINDDEKKNKKSNKKIKGNEEISKRKSIEKFQKLNTFNYSNIKKINKKEEVNESDQSTIKFDDNVVNSSSIIERKESNIPENNISKNNLESSILPEKKISENKLNLKRKKTLSRKPSPNKNIIENVTISNKNNINLFSEKFRLLTKKQLVYDSLDDEEIEDEEEINTCYIDPNSNFSLIFDSILFLMTIISLFEIPLFLAMNHNFCRNNKLDIECLFNLILELMNIIDLFLGFFRAFYNWEEQLIHKNKLIVENYIFSWFLFDLIASLPFYSIYKIKEKSCNKKELSSYYNIVLNNLHYLLLSNKLFKVNKIFDNNQAFKAILKIFNDYEYIKIKMIVNIFLFLASVNYTACLYIFIGRNSFPNWIFHSHLETKGFINIYICSIYILIAAVTTVGYGDITCYSLNERIFQLLLLIIGIMSYSAVISFLSSYIKKINERSIEFEKRVLILKEIKITHPNFPDNLYDRIIRHLKFKIIYEKKLKNIIFDCLPVGLKNNLILEMYKPIINNFIFFKNFQNTDFIVRVILAFKPIMAFRNDILVNDEELVKEIMFVKKGMLSVELPINIMDYEENVKKYLKNTNNSLDKTFYVKKLRNSRKISGNSLYYDDPNLDGDENIKEKNSFFNKIEHRNSSNYMKYSPTFPHMKKKLQTKCNHYIRIVCIRENEHFGDVLMFLEQKSPLRVRVRSKKCELFFLKKIDAINISTSYQNIWKRINKKSVYNYEQMKKYIKKIVEIYCSVKLTSYNSKKGLSNNILKKSSAKNLNGLSYKANFKNINLNGESKNKKIKNFTSIIIPKNQYEKYFKKLLAKEDLSFINIENDRLCSSSINLKTKLNYNFINIKEVSSLNSSHSSLLLEDTSFLNSSNNRNTNKKVDEKENIKNDNQKKDKYGQKVVDIFNENYKFYQGINLNSKHKKRGTIISEQEQEGTLNPYHYTNSIKKFGKFPIQSLSTLKSIHKNLSRKDFFSIIDNNKENESDSSFDQNINKEFYSDEEIKINNCETLLNKKIELVSTNKENLEVNSNNNSNSKEYKNSKLEILLNSFENSKVNELINNQYINNSFEVINENNSFKSEINNKNDETNKNSFYNFKSNNNKEDKNNIPLIDYPITKNQKLYNLKINNNISFKINSSYENCNKICENKLIGNNYFKKKLKNFLIEEICKLTDLKNNNILKKTNTLEHTENNKKEKMKYLSKNRSKSIIDNINKSSKNEFKGINYSKTSKLINRASSTIENEKQKIHPYNRLFKTGIFIEPTNRILSKKTGKGRTICQKDFLYQNINILNNINNNFNSFNNSTFGTQIKNKNSKNFSTNIPYNKFKKRRGSLLSQINFNIQKTNQNLNNPEEFYSNYFNSILEGEIIGKHNQKNFTFYPQPIIKEKSKTKKDIKK